MSKATPPFVHLGDAVSIIILCGVLSTYDPVTDTANVPEWTDDPEKVTCLNCKTLMADKTAAQVATDGEPR